MVCGEEKMRTKLTWKIWLLIIVLAFSLISIFGIPPTFLEKGVLITSVETNSTAFEQGLRQGQIITSINNKQIENLGIGKLIELTYVKDKEVRKELIEKAEDLTRDELKEEVKKVREDDLYKGIKRKAQREDSDLYTENDDPLAKCKRQAQNILQDIQRLSYPINNMETRLKNWVKFSRKFKDKDINKLKKAISNEWKKIRVRKTSDDWFD